MKKYGVLYSDPPWKFGTYSDKGKGRSAEAWYDCMELKDIISLRIGEQWAADDCVLLLWVTDPFLKHGLQVMDAWGFEYKTVGFYWVKGGFGDDYGNPRYDFPMGTGYWTRANPEQCLLGTRGHPKRLNADVRKLIISPRREHSRKPDEIYDRIERLCTGPYLELFARNQHPGWDAWGSEVETGPNTERRWKSNEGPGAKPLQLGNLEDLL
jgi:N6-adenosine-specific RNA methylase IME4